MKTAYRIDSNGIYIGSVELDVSDKSPLEPDVYLFPAGVVEDAPPAPNAGEFVKRENGVWVIFRVPVESQHVPLVPPPPPIAPISPRQIRQALTRAGLRTAVETAVAAGDQDLKDWYEFSTAFERNNAQVVAMGAALNVSESDLDQLWALGATL
jgi:hypothetical protein